AEGILEDMPVD
nr:Chain A, Alpha-synuclein 110-120 [Homo sapiens]